MMQAVASRLREESPFCIKPDGTYELQGRLLCELLVALTQVESSKAVQGLHDKYKEQYQQHIKPAKAMHSAPCMTEGNLTSCPSRI